MNLTKLYNAFKDGLDMTDEQYAKLAGYEKCYVSGEEVCFVDKKGKEWCDDLENMLLCLFDWRDSHEKILETIGRCEDDYPEFVLSNGRFFRNGVELTDTELCRYIAKDL